MSQAQMEISEINILKYEEEFKIIYLYGQKTPKTNTKSEDKMISDFWCFISLIIVMGSSWSSSNYRIYHQTL